MSRQNRTMITVIALLPVIIALAMTAFTWPSARLAPRDLPIGLAGPASATAPIKQQLAESSGVFDVHSYPGEDAAREA
ncbi:MAG: hypothetical protein ACRDTD_20115, partial [Pseudonocardiaceae bacterium]